MKSVKMFNGLIVDFYSWYFMFQADSKLRALSASYRLQKPDRRFEELKNYSNELQKHITDILKIRAVSYFHGQCFSLVQSCLDTFQKPFSANLV